MAIATEALYTPSPPTIAPQTEDGRNLADWMQRELHLISNAFSDATALELRPISAPATNPRQGMIVYADGISWNPNGLGAGAYVYSGTQWLPVGFGQAGTGGGGRLSVISTTQIKFLPFNGDRTKVNGVWYAIPSAGISAGNTGVFVNGTPGSNLNPSTVYNIYEFNNTGTPTIDFSTTTHATDTTVGNVGVEIKSGDSTRSLIGMCRTDAASHFVSGPGAQLFLLNWFNRKTMYGNSTVVVGVASVGGPWVEISSSARVEFLNWGPDMVFLYSYGLFEQDNLGQVSYAEVGLDGATPVGPVGLNVTPPTAGVYWPYFAGTAYTPGAEGYHFTTALGGVSGGTGHWTTFSGVLIFGG